MKINRFAMISLFTAAVLTVGFSLCAAVKAEVPGINQSNVIFYWAGDIRQHVVAKVINRFNPRLTESKASAITATIIKEAEEFGLDPFLITAVIAAESSFRPNVVSPCRAMGLMQLTKGVSQAFHLSDPFDIKQNIHGGSRYLDYLKQRFRIDELILAAYNAGPTRVARLGRVPRIRETIGYIKKIAVLRHFMSGEWHTVLENILKTPVILPFSKGIFSDGIHQSFTKALKNNLIVKSSTFGSVVVRPFFESLGVPLPILDNRRLQLIIVSTMGGKPLALADCFSLKKHLGFSSLIVYPASAG